MVDQALVDATPQSKIFEYLARIRDKIPYVEGKIIKAILEKSWKEKGLPDKPVPVDKKAEKVKVEKK